MESVPRSTDSFEDIYRWNRDGRPPSITIVEAVAAMEGTDPTELDIFLNDFLDPEALDRLFLGENGANASVELRVSEYHVTIRPDGSLRIRSIEGDDRVRSSTRRPAVSEFR